MRRLTHVLLLCCALFLVAGATAKAQAAEPAPDLPPDPAPAPNIIRYVPEEAWEEGMTTQEQDAAAHTIHWLTGIVPPRMPHEIGTTQERQSAPTIGDFLLLDEDNKPIPASQRPEHSVSGYTSPYMPGNHWYDVNKINESSGLDSQLCFAVAMTNILHWWLDQNQKSVQAYYEWLPSEDPHKKQLEGILQNRKNSPSDPSPMGPVLQAASSSNLYQKSILPAFSDKPGGGQSDLVADFFINGYNPQHTSAYRNGPLLYPPTPKSTAGVFSPVFGRSTLTDRIHPPQNESDVRNTRLSYENLSEMLRENMDKGFGTVVAYQILGSGHAVTLWGVEYDAAQRLCALYITDNNDPAREGGTQLPYYIEDEKDRPLIGMIRYDAFEGENYGLNITRDADRKTSSWIYCVYMLTQAHDLWAQWNDENHQSVEAEGGFPYLNPYFDVPHEHQPQYTVNGSTIEETCALPGCYHRASAKLSLKDAGPFLYTGHTIRPKYTVSFDVDLLCSKNAEITYGENINAGETAGKIYMKLADHTAVLTFPIEPITMPQPEQGPELLSKNAFYLAVQPVPGLEYSINGQDWTTSGTFYDLTPNTPYTVSVRTAAPDTNHAPSQPAAKTLSVQTDASEADLGDPCWSIEGLEQGTVTVVNTGKAEAVTLVIAGYDSHGRQTFVTTRAIESGAGRSVQVHFTDNSNSHRAFLVDQGFAPVIPADPAA